MRGLAIAALVLLAAPAAAQAQVTRERAVELGAEAYRYGLPLLEFLRVRGEMTSSQRVNSFYHARRFARPQDRTVVAPNVDTRYRIVFRPGQLPPVRAFWSLTLYDGESYLVPNPAKRYAVGNSHPPLHRRPDGSIVVRIQPERPREPRVNWLPSPRSDGFRLSLRLYWPKRSVLRGAWRPPPVERLP